MALNWENYVGIPWLPGGRTERGCDCYGLAELIYWREFGLDIFRPVHPDADSDEATAVILDRAQQPPWTPAAGEVQPFDLVIAELPRVGEAPAAYVTVATGRRSVLRLFKGGLSAFSWMPNRVLCVVRHEFVVEACL